MIETPRTREENEELARRVREAMGWRKHILDAIVVAILTCAVCSFAAGWYAWYDRRGAWDVVGWMGFSLALFAASFVGWCVLETTAEEVVKSLADDDREDRP